MSLEARGFTDATPIQEKAFSVIMSGKSCLGIAQTGTGKTLSYLLPMFNQWKFVREVHPSMLILVPTRELAVQVEEEANKLADGTAIRIAAIFGGANINNHKKAVAEGLDVLIATPGRLIDLISTGNVRLKNVKKLVIDEVDEMMGQGFMPQLNRIFDSLPERRQNLLFSATVTEEVEAFISENFHEVVRVEAAPSGTPLDKIQQSAWVIPNFYTGINLLSLLLNTRPEMTKVLVFASSIKLADAIYKELDDCFTSDVDVIHSNRAQNTRFSVIDRFNSGKLRVLVATDVVARGVDISDVSHVINFDLPEDPESYIHRIGRTGRADKEGIAFTLVRDKERFAAVCEYIKTPVPLLDLPEGLHISDQLVESDLPVIKMKNPSVKHVISGPSFHEKKPKNMKVNMHLTREEQHRLKYGKPKTKGDKFRKKK